MTELASHGAASLEFKIVLIHSEDGRWIAEIESLPGVLAYGATDTEARSKVEALALRAIAEQIDIDQSAPDKICFAVWLG